MPEQYQPIRRHPGKPAYRIADAAKEGILVVVKCNGCHRGATYLASDLVDVVGGQWPAHEAPFDCGRCRSREWVKVTLRSIHPGDAGRLVVRRPGEPRMVRDWKDVVY